MAPPDSRSFTITLRHTTVGRTPLDRRSAHRRNLYLTTHNTHNRQTSMSSGKIRTHNLIRRATADPRLRPRGHWDRREIVYSLLIQEAVCFVRTRTTVLFIHLCLTMMSQGRNM